MVSRSCYAFVLLPPCLLLFYGTVALVVADDAMQPVAAEEIDRATFQEKFNAGDFLLVNFVGPGCRTCKEFAPIFDQVENELTKVQSDVKAAIMSDTEVIQRFDFHKLPALVFFRKGIPLLYEAHHEVEEIMAWIADNKEVSGRTLKDDDFEHLTQASTGSTAGDWLVQFCVQERPQCDAILAIFETVAYRLKGKINVATVDIKQNPALAKRFKVNVDRTPYVVLFHRGKMFPYGLYHFGIASLAHFAEKSYKHVQAIPVVPPPAPFDELTESIANQLKMVQSKIPGGMYAIILAIGLVCMIILCRLFGRKSSPIETGFSGPKKGV